MLSAVITLLLPASLHVPPGDKVVTFRYGQFSHLWIDMMERMGLDVTVIDRPWGEGADESILQVGAGGALGPTSRLLGPFWAVEVCRGTSTLGDV